MNKVIITGHPASGLEKVESLLHGCGLSPALPSRREGLLPAEIHGILRKVHQIPEARTITDEQGFFPAEIGPVWHGMAMDLMLGNLGREPWGWADPDSLFFLDYWRMLDPEIVFVLVYDSPASALRTVAVDDAAASGPDVVRRQLDNWAAFNSAMLRFHLRNADRCVLVHSRQIQGGYRYCIEEIQSRLSAPLQAVEADPGEALERSCPGDDNGSITEPPGLPRVMVDADHPTAHFLIECQLSQHPGYRALYDELQAAANLPLEGEENTSFDSSGAWTAWLRERHAVVQTVHQMRLRQQESDVEIARLRQEHESLLTQHARARQTLENELLRRQDDLRLGALQHAQLAEDLDLALLENRSLRLQLARCLPAPSQSDNDGDNSANAPTGAAQRVKQQLSYRLGSLMVSHAKRPLLLVLLPFSLAAEALRFQREKRRAPADPLPPLHEYADAHLAARVKKQLSYRLGNTLVRRCKSPLGWVILPFALIRQIQAFQRSRNSAE